MRTVEVSHSVSRETFSTRSLNGRASARPRSKSALGNGYGSSEQGACENCFDRQPFDLYVDVTAALRAGKIAPKNVVLHVLVH